MESRAVVSPDGVHRYQLARIWDPTLPKLGWLMLNPSKADATVNDPTIRRCIGFAKDNGYGSILVTNLFAYRATDPRDLLTVVRSDLAKAVGPDNNAAIAVAMGEVERLVIAWGANAERPILIDRARLILKAIKAHPRVSCLGLTKAGQPLHPLMVPASQKFLGFRIPEGTDKPITWTQW